MRHEHKPSLGSDLACGQPHGHPREHGARPAHEHPLGGHSHASHRPREKKRLLAAVIITAATMVVEIIGGVLTGSLALISDAGHMLTHAAALGISLAAIWMAARPTTPERSFGLYRVEVLAAVFNAVTLIAITGFIAAEAWRRLLHPGPILVWEMFGVALFGLFVNLVTALILSGADQKDLNFRSAFLHMVGDTLSSAAIVIGALVIRYTGRTWIDPILSVLICAVILLWAWSLLRDSVRVLLEGAPKGLRVETVRGAIRERFDCVHDVDDVHIWTITSRMNAMTAYVELTGEMPLAEQEDLAHKLRHFVADEFGISHAVFQFVPKSQ